MPCLRAGAKEEKEDNRRRDQADSGFVGVVTLRLAYSIVWVSRRLYGKARWATKLLERAAQALSPEAQNRKARDSAPALDGTRDSV